MKSPTILKLSNENDRTSVEKALEKAKKTLSKQDNVLVQVPPKGLELGYTVICDREIAKKKYPHLVHVDV